MNCTAVCGDSPTDQDLKQTEEQNELKGCVIPVLKTGDSNKRPLANRLNPCEDTRSRIDQAKSEMENGSPMPFKRRRGRPRKADKLLQHINIKIESGPTSSGDIMKKKRGRPRKYNSNYSRDLSKECVKIVIGTSANGLESTIKKKRGRPPKTRIETSANGLEFTIKKKRGRPPKIRDSAQSSRNLFEQCNQEKINQSQNSLNNIDDGSPIEEPNICNEPSENHEQSSAQPYILLRPIKNLIEDMQLLDASSDLPKGFGKPVEVGVLPLKKGRGRPKKAEIAGNKIKMTHGKLTRRATSKQIKNRLRRRVLSLTKPKEEKQGNKNTYRKMISSTGSLGIKIVETFSLSASSNSWQTQMIPEVVVNGNGTEFKEEPESSGEIDEEPEWSEEIGNDSNERKFFDTCTIKPNFTNQPIANGNTSEIDEESEWAEEIGDSFYEGNSSDNQIAEPNFTNQPRGNSNASATTVFSNNVIKDSSCTESILGDHYISTLDRNPFSKVLGKEFLKNFALQEQLPSFLSPIEGKDHIGHSAKKLYSRKEGTCYEGNPKHSTPVNLSFTQQNDLNTLENQNNFKMDGVSNKNCVNAGKKSLLDVQVKMSAKELYEITKPYFTSLKQPMIAKVTTFDDIINLKFLEMAAEMRSPK